MMNQFVILSLLVTLSFVAGQFGFNSGFEKGVGQGRGLAGFDAFDTNLFAQDRFGVNSQAKLNKANRDKVQLAKANNVGARGKAAARKAAKEQALINKDAKAEAYDNQAHFNNLDAAASENGARKTGFQFVDEIQHSEKAALSANDGAKKSFGNRAAVNENAAAETVAHADIFDAAEVFDNGALQFGVANDNQLSAAELLDKKSEQQVQARDGAQSKLSLQDEIFAGNSLANNGGFFFGKRRR